MAIPVIQTVSSGTRGSTSSTNLDLPAGVLSGDLLVALVTQRNAAAVFTFTGWTAIGSAFGSGTTVALMYYRIADGSEGTTAAISSTVITTWNFTVLRVTGHAAAGPVVVSLYGAVTASTTPTIAGITTTGDDRLVFAGLFSPVAGASPYTPPGGWTGQSDLTNAAGSGSSMSCITKLQATAGATGDPVLTATVSTGGVGAMAAVVPAALSIIYQHAVQIG